MKVRKLKIYNFLIYNFFLPRVLFTVPGGFTLCTILVGRMPEFEPELLRLQPCVLPMSYTHYSSNIDMLTATDELHTHITVVKLICYSNCYQWATHITVLICWLLSPYSEAICCYLCYIVGYFRIVNKWVFLNVKWFYLPVIAQSEALMEIIMRLLYSVTKGVKRKYQPQN